MPDKVALEYADAIRDLFASTAESKDRSALGPVDTARVPAAAERGLSLSEQLTASLALNLSAGSPDQRALAATQLLAKALTDLETSAYLKNLADDEASPKPSGQTSGVERSAGTTGLEDYLNVIVEETPAPPTADRSRSLVTDSRAALEDLSVKVEDSLTLIANRGLEIARTSFQKLASLGLAEIMKAAGIVGSGMAGVLGLSDQVSTLYRLCRDFALRAYNAIAALLGDALAKIAGEKVVAWLKEHTNKDLAAWLRQQYGIPETAADLKKIINSSRADVSIIGLTASKIDILSTQFGRQSELMKKLLGAIDYVRMIPGISTPNGISLLAATYILIGGYAVFAAADYLDARALELLNRIVGIPTLIHENL